jgi:putative inorganic carbon (HCO3(-)) transporter
VQAYAKRNVLGTVAALVALLGCSVVGALAITVLAGTKTGVVLGLAAIAGPALVYVAIVAPLIFPFGLYVLLVPFDNLLDVGSFGTLTKLLAIAAGAAIILYLARKRRALPPPKSLLMWGAVYAWAAVTAFWALDQQAVFRLLLTSVELLILYGAISILPAERSTVRWVALATVAGGVLAAGYGAYLFHSGADIYYGGRLRITNATGAIDPNQFAAALLLPIALCINNVLVAKRGTTIALNVAALAVMFVGVAVSESRGAVLALVAMLIYMFVRGFRRARLGALTAAIAIAAAAFSTQTGLWSRFGYALSTGGAGRTSIWRVGLVALKSHWLIGAGYNNFPFAYDEAFLKTPHQIWGMASWHRGSHNLLIGTSVELGLIGLCLMLAAWVVQFRVLDCVAARDPDYGLRIALEATVIGTFVAALFLDIMAYKYVWLTFMLIALVRNAHYLRRTQGA